MLKILNSCRTYVPQRFFYSSHLILCKVGEGKKKNEKRKVKETVELVNVVDRDDKFLGLKPKQEAQKLASKLNLLLIGTNDTKYGKIYPTYKMVSAADAFKSGIPKKAPSQGRTIKKLALKCTITDHDLSIKINTIKKWLQKDCEINVAISGSNDSTSMRKTVFKKIQQELKEVSRITDIRDAEDSLRFSIFPPKKEKTPIDGSKETVQHTEAKQNEEIKQNVVQNKVNEDSSESEDIEQTNLQMKEKS